MSTSTHMSTGTSAHTPTATSTRTPAGASAHSLFSGWTHWFRFALQNTLRNRRRSAVTVSIAALGTAAILLAGGFALFTYESLAQAAARDTGHLVLGTPASFTTDEDVPLQHGLSNVDALRQQLLADPAVRQVLPKVVFSGLISNGGEYLYILYYYLLF